MNGLQVIHPINTLTFKDEISCTDSLWIRKNKNAVAMENSPLSSIKQVGIIVIGLTYCRKYRWMSFDRLKFFTHSYHL